VFVSAGIVVLSLALRFAIGPAARESLPALPLLDFALGIRGIDGVSYPFSPWIAYASGGFALGCLYPAATRGRVAWPLAAASLGIAALGLSAWMEWRGSAPFRWGTMNATFFVLSVGLVAAAAVACRLLTVGFPRVARQLALGGVASFAFIPVHYALLHGMQPAVAPASQASFFAFCAVIVLLAWALAQGFARAAASRAVLERPTLAHAFFGVSLAAFLAAVASGTFATRPGAGFASTVAIQLMIAALLGFRQSSTAASRAQVRP